MAHFPTFVAFAIASTSLRSIWAFPGEMTFFSTFEAYTATTRLSVITSPSSSSTGISTTSSAIATTASASPSRTFKTFVLVTFDLHWFVFNFRIDFHFFFFFRLGLFGSGFIFVVGIIRTVIVIIIIGLFLLCSFFFGSFFLGRSFVLFLIVGVVIRIGRFLLSRSSFLYYWS